MSGEKWMRFQTGLNGKRYSAELFSLWANKHYISDCFLIVFLQFAGVKPCMVAF